MFESCLIANRGEIAVRIIRACREIGVRACAVYSDADEGALHVRLADEARRIGGPSPVDSYLNIPALLEAAQALNCAAVHPGYGFLSENPAFAEAVIAAGLVWIGPPPAAMRAMGSKTAARALMQAAGVPIVPGFQHAGATAADYRQAAAAIGYPVMVKAAAGGGGRGIRIVHTPAELIPALEAARREAGNAFGDASVFLEKYIEHAHHIEVQVMGDTHGQIVHLFERDCSSQRRQQKVIEESPSPLIGTDSELRARVCAAGVEAARAVGYINAGTVEFIATPGGDFYFLEMNTRLQVEHPVTEWVTGIDLVKTQFAIAAGDPLPFTQSDITQRGHAIEVRLYAEDTREGFAPAPGRLLTFQAPTGAGIRVDGGFEAGDSIPLHYDALIAKIIVYDATRSGAIDRLRAALRATVVVGVTTNLPLVRALIAHPAFAASQVDTHFIERHLADLLPAPPPLTIAAIAAALLEYDAAAPTPSAETAPPPRFVDPWSTVDSFRVGG